VILNSRRTRLFAPHPLADGKRHERGFLFSLISTTRVNSCSRNTAHQSLPEGDAIIVALLEREGEAMLGVGRTCVLAWEIVISAA